MDHTYEQDTTGGSPLTPEQRIAGTFSEENAKHYMDKGKWFSAEFTNDEQGMNFT